MRVFIAAMSIIYSANSFAIAYNTKNHVYLGINPFYRDYSEDFIAPKKSDEHGLLYGVILAYEHKAPNSFMFETDFNLAYGDTTYDGSTQTWYGDYIGPLKSTTGNGFANINFQAGYTFSSEGKHLLTPFLGLGASSWFRSLDYDELYSWSYFSYGLQYDYNPNCHWQYGVHVKAMPMLNGTMVLADYDDREITLTLGNKVHYEVSIPIIYQRNANSKYCYRFTPYYQYQEFGESDYQPLSYYYPFSFIPNVENRQVYVQEPASRTHIVGLKIEFGIGFL